jgi:hypothetical protein
MGYVDAYQPALCECPLANLLQPIVENRYRQLQTTTECPILDHPDGGGSLPLKSEGLQQQTFGEWVAAKIRLNFRPQKFRIFLDQI